MAKETVVKKAYSKPNVEFVDFSLSGSIAATCTYQGTNTDSNSCGYLDNGWILYATVGICDMIVTDPNFCYHVPTEETSVFSS